MKRLLTILALVIVLPTTAIAEQVSTHINELLLEWKTAFNAGDSAAVANLYTEDAAVFPPGQERVDGRSAIQTFWQGVIGSGVKVDDFHSVKVSAWNNIAEEIGSLTFIVQSDSGPAKVTGKYIVIYKRTGHTWQLHRDIWNMN
jgi:uncharacterized protein (TIGR02246 family)